MTITPELSYLISLVAEAKMHFLIAAQGTKPGTPERARELKSLEKCHERTREYVNAKFNGIEHVPRPIAVDYFVCEKGLAKLKESERETT